MNSFFRALYFFYILFTGKHKAAVCTSHVLTLMNGEGLSLDKYYAPQRQHFYGTILFIHGMNKYGNQDPRVIAACRALAQCGYIALAPTYTKITKFLMGNEHIDEIEQSIQAMLADPQLTPTNKVAIFTASYSGAIALRSISRLSIGANINVFCSVGSPNTPLSAYTNAFRQGGSPDQYAKLILIKNLLRFNKPFDLTIDQALDYAIDDEFNQNSQNSLATFVSQQSLPQQQKIFLVLNSLNNTHHYLETHLDSIQNFNQEFMNSADLKNLQSRVVLIHSATDKLFPAAETETLYQELLHYQIPCKKLITPLLDHANYKFSPRKILAFLSMLNTFAYFFYHASKKANRKNVQQHSQLNPKI